MAAVLGRKQDIWGRKPVTETEILHSGHVPLPVGSGTACGASARLHRERHLCEIQAFEGIQRAASHGLRRLWASGGAVRHPDRPASRKDHGAEHQPLPRAAGQTGALI